MLRFFFLLVMIIVMIVSVRVVVFIVCLLIRIFKFIIYLNFDEIDKIIVFVVVVFKDKFIINGFVKIYFGVKGSFGNIVYCFFCFECGFFIVYDFDVVFEIIVLKVGIFDIEIKKNFKFVCCCFFGLIFDCVLFFLLI